MVTEINETRKILAERGNRYGKYRDNANISQELKVILDAHMSAIHKPYHREALTVICQKIARIINGDPDYTDNWQDIIGYSQLVLDEISTQEKT